MKKYISILIIFISSCGYGQYPAHPKIRRNPLIGKDSCLTLDVSETYYGYAGIKQEKQPFDSVKYWRKQFLLYQDRMNKSSGRAFDRYEDSCTKYYKLLYRQK